MLFANDRKSKKAAWSVRVPIRVQAMAVGPKHLALVGPPDIVDPDDPLASFQERKGGVLRVVSNSSGNKLTEMKLESPPVLNGIAVANEQLIITQRNGKIISVSN